MLYESFKDIDRALVQVGGAVPLLILSWRGSCPPCPPGSCVLDIVSVKSIHMSPVSTFLTSIPTLFSAVHPQYVFVSFLFRCTVHTAASHDFSHSYNISSLAQRAVLQLSRESAGSGNESPGSSPLGARYFPLCGRWHCRTGGTGVGRGCKWTGPIVSGHE